MKLAIDAGHGAGNRKPGQVDPGAVGGGETEAGIVIAYGKTLKFVAQSAGLPVFMVNTGEDENPVGGRDEQAERNGCTHYLSIHCNAAAASTTSGTETLYRDSTDLLFGAKVHRASVQALQLRDRGMKPETVSPHGRLAIFDFDGSACLVELGFISNAADRAKLLVRETRVLWARLVISTALGFKIPA